MKIITAMQTKNPTYTLARPIKQIGIFVHSTGASNPQLGRYVDAPGYVKPNKYGNHWNKSTARKSMHAFVGLDINDEVAVIQTLPYNVACWGAGAGKKGSANRDPYAHIQFEVCEDNAPRSGLPPTPAQTKYYHDVWKLTEDYCVYLCEKFGFPASAITSHYEAAAAGLASNHGDPRHWMRLFDDSMDKFRKRVAERLAKKDEEVTPAPVEPEKPVTPATPVAPTAPKHTIFVRLSRAENLSAAGDVPAGTVREYDFEEYVATVVASEVGNANPAAAEAQAIAARTYAWPLVLNRGAIDDTSSAQAFRLSRYRNNTYAKAYAGAEKTRGLTLGYNGLTIPKIYYADSNGGQMIATSEKWGKIYMPWHIRKTDPWDLAATKGIVNGHQIGMSQKGANYAAGQGKTVAEILAFYYPETAIIAATNTLATIPKAPGAPLPPAKETLYLAKVATRYPAGLSLWVDPQKTKRAHNSLVPQGSTIAVLSAPNEGFVYARYNGMEGYVDNQYLKKIADIPAPVIPGVETKVVRTNKKAGINLWNNTLKFRKLIQVPEGARITILKNESARWAYAEYNGVKGYADRNYLI